MSVKKNCLTIYKTYKDISENLIILVLCYTIKKLGSILDIDVYNWTCSQIQKSYFVKRFFLYWIIERSEKSPSNKMRYNLNLLNIWNQVSYFHKTASLICLLHSFSTHLDFRLKLKFCTWVLKYHFFQIDYLFWLVGL